ncbi:helix-turn-helix domain-containing protein [Corynebacterium macginleyi]
MDLVLQGWSVRQICSTVRCSHTTVQKARHTMAEHQITTHAQIASITQVHPGCCHCRVILNRLVVGAEIITLEGPNMRLEANTE